MFFPLSELKFCTFLFLIFSFNNPTCVFGSQLNPLIAYSTSLIYCKWIWSNCFNSQNLPRRCSPKLFTTLSALSWYLYNIDVSINYFNVCCLYLFDFRGCLEDRGRWHSRNSMWYANFFYNEREKSNYLKKLAHKLTSYSTQV